VGQLRAQDSSAPIAAICTNRAAAKSQVSDWFSSGASSLNQWTGEKCGSDLRALASRRASRCSSRSKPKEVGQLPRGEAGENEFIGFRDVATHVPQVMVASARGGLKVVPVVFKETFELETIFTT
jgi:hypothetical protein